MTAMPSPRPKQHTLLLLALLNACSYGFQLSPSLSSPVHTRPQRQSSRYAASTVTRATSSSNDEISIPEIQTLYKILSDNILLFDPSRGTCCRNKCSGCTYLDDTGNFIFGEYKNAYGSDLDGWLPPYVKVDFGDRVHVSKWSEILFPSSEDKKEVEKEEFLSLLVKAAAQSKTAADEGETVGTAISEVSPLAIQALWTILSPSAGYPRLSSNEIVRAIKGMDGSMYDKGGAINYKVFEKSMLDAAEQFDIDGDNNIKVVDYDPMSKEELLDLCVERGMKTTFPKMKRIIIEELRFFDANGRQGKRHPVKNTLS